MKKISFILCFLMLVLAGFSQKTIASNSPANPRDEAKEIKFYPNPASTTINFELSNITGKPVSLQVYSFLGRQVMKVPVTSNRLTINVTDLMRGVYVFQVRDASGRVLATNKFQVSH